MLDWGFNRLMEITTLHSPSHGYVLDDTVKLTVQFERITEGSDSVSGRSSSELAYGPV